jgi:hypothetical protein
MTMFFMGFKLSPMGVAEPAFVLNYCLTMFSHHVISIYIYMIHHPSHEINSLSFCS